jgi:hypothetical protein
VKGRLSRRDALTLLATGTTVGLAGCLGGGDDGERGDDTATDTPVDPSGTDGGDASADDASVVEGRPAGTVGAVTEVLARGPLQIQVQRAAQVETVEVFGLSRAPEEGAVAFEVSLAIKNASEAYCSFSTDSFGLLADDAVVADQSSFAALTSQSFGGVALAPGELRVYELVYEAPADAARYGVGGAFSVRPLPGAAFASVGRVVVDFADDAGGDPLVQSLSVPLRAFDESVAVGGVEATVREAFVRDEVAGRPAPEGSEFVVLDVAGTNGSPLPVAFGVGVGGFALRDDAGRSYTSAGGVRDGRIDDREILRLPNGLAPGDSAAGLQVAVVPAGTTPLYVSYTAPPALWIGSEDVAEHTFFWQIR